jgi:hypothetical protein
MLASGRWVRSVAVGAIADNSGKDLLKLHGALGVAGAFAPGFAYKVRGYRRFRISANEAGDRWNGGGSAQPHGRPDGTGAPDLP